MQHLSRRFAVLAALIAGVGGVVFSSAPSGGSAADSGATATVQDDGTVAVYQGLPWDLGFGVKLYRVVWESPLIAANLSQSERRQLFDHELQSRDGAIREVNAYARGVVP